MSTATLANLFQEIPFLASLPTDHLEAMAAAGELVDVPAGELLVSEGDSAESLYLILAGSVSVQGHNEQGQEVPLSGLEAGQFFGELALAESGTRSASVRSETACRLFRLGRIAFINLLGQAPELLPAVFSAISEKIRSANTHFFEEQLQKQALQLKLQREHHQSIARLITGMADEVQAPLRDARHLSEELGRQLDGSPLRELCLDLQLQLRQMQQRVEMFRAISNEQIEDRAEPVHWQDVFDAFLDIYSMVSDHPLPIELVLTPEAAHATWIGYPGILHTILLHLLNNAEQHAYPGQKGTVEIQITVRGQAGERCFEVSVRDQGVGMSPELAAHATEPFVSSRRQDGLSGLGLAVVESLVSRVLGGKLEIRSTPGEGSQINLQIPVRTPQSSMS